MRWVPLFLVLVAVAWWLTRPREAPPLVFELPPLREAAIPPAVPDAPLAVPASLPATNAGFCPTPGEKLLGYARPSLNEALRAIPPEAQAAVRSYAQARTQKESSEAIARAYALAQNEPAIALAYAQSALHTKAWPAAVPALDTYLRVHPRDIGMSRLRARLSTQKEIEASFEVVEDGELALRYPPELIGESEARRLAAEVVAALREAAQLTDTPVRTELLVTVYRDRSELLAVTCTPSWAAGLYDGTLRLVHEGADKESLRHEALHAQLAPLLPPQPLWFHEGLAQYFGGPFRFSRAYRLMIDNKTYIPFSSLEGSFFVFDGNADAALAYAQSVAMIHMLVDTLGPAVIPKAIAHLREHPREPNLIKALGEIDEHTLLRWLESKDSTRR